MDENEAPGDERAEQAAREAVERGIDVREEVRAITTAALSSGQLDTARVKRVVDAVMAGVSTGAAEDSARAREHMTEAVQGVDEALGQAAKVMQLAAEEARERFSEFGEEDLERAREDLRTLESILVDALADLRDRSSAMFSDVWSDLERHYRDSGSEVGRQASKAFSDAAAQLREAGAAQAAASWDQALSAGAQLAQVASGMLAGVADTLAAARDGRGTGGEAREDGDESRPRDADDGDRNGPGR